MTTSPEQPRVAPILETGRLYLRSHALRDLEPVAEMWADPVVTRFIGGQPRSRQDSWSRLLRYLGHWCLKGYGYWAVFERASGRFVGDVGMADGKRDIEPRSDGIPEIGWALAPWCHGRGYATEAVSAVVGWADLHFRHQRTICFIDPENHPSLRVADKCGYRACGEVLLDGERSLVFERWIGSDSNEDSGLEPQE